jgi:arginyl-tRNA synthetase
MYAKQKAKQEIVAALKRAIGKGYTVQAAALETPKKKEMGDIAFPCFELAKGQKRNPVEIATEIAAKIGGGEIIKSAKADGPYVNFFLKNEVYTEGVLEDVAQKKRIYGAATIGEGTKILLEYAQPNTHKEFHVGHIRNGILGQAIVNVLRANGYEVTAASYIGDIGAHVAKAIWGMETFHKGEKFEKNEQAKRIGEIYAEASAYLNDHPEVKPEIDDVQKKLEAREEPWASKWKETRGWCLEAFKEIFAELQIKPDTYYYESEVEGPGKEMVKKMLTDGIAKKSDGAVIVDLEEDSLDIFLILKSDGSSLYATKDLALAYKKEKDHNPDRQIIVTDDRQSFYFKQLFTTLKRMDFKASLTHIPYEMVNLPDGTMSSRSGNIVTFDNLKADMTHKLIEETKKRHEDWDEKKIKKTAHALAIASMQFMMLRQDPNSIITFDMDEALSFDGVTAPYIMYSLARISSIEKKTKVRAKYASGDLKHPLEQELIRMLAQYPSVVERVGSSFQISSIAMWAYDCAKLFSEYYHEVKLLDEKGEDVLASRLALLASIKKTINNALSLLGIDTIDEM